MSSSRRIIPITLDDYTSDRRVVSGTDLKLPDGKQQLDLYYGTQNLFRATILDGAVSTAFNPVQPCTWLYGLDDIPFSDELDYVLSQDDQFNITDDWVELNEIGGKICWRADLATDELKTGLKKSSANRVLMYSNLWMKSAVGNVVWSWPTYVNKVHIDPSTAKPVTGVTHLTTDAAAASYVKKWEDNAYVRRKNGRDQYLFPDGKWRTKYHTLTDGEPTETWGAPED